MEIRLNQEGAVLNQGVAITFYLIILLPYVLQTPFKHISPCKKKEIFLLAREGKA